LKIFSRISIEDIFKIVSDSFLEMQKKKDLIQSSFMKPGYIKDEMEILQNEIENLLIEEEIPFEDDLSDDEGPVLEESNQEPFGENNHAIDEEDEEFLLSG